MKPFRSALLRLKSLFTCQRGNSLIEFAFVLPLLLLMFVGVVEISRYVLLQEKLVNASNSLGQYVAQQKDPAQMGDLTNAYASLLKPFSFDGGKSGFIVSTITRDTANDTLRVTEVQNHGYTTGSKFTGAHGLQNNFNTVLLPNPTYPGLKDTLIVVETFYKYNNIIPGAKFISSALDFDTDVYHYGTVLKRFNSPNNTGPGTEVTTLPTPYGCCGEYCRGRDKPDQVLGLDIECRPCVPPNARQQCVNSAAAYKAFEGKIPYCNNNCKAPQRPCRKNEKTCRCDETYCPHKGG